MTAIPKAIIFEDTPNPGLFKLVTSRKHAFAGDRTLSTAQGLESLSPHESREWHCGHCGLKRITVMPKDAPARREWRRCGEARRYAAWEMPGCEVVG